MSIIPHNGTSSATPSIEGESILENLIEECTNRLQGGEAIDVDELARRHPEHAERLRRLLPSLEMMAEVGRTSIRPLGADFPTTGSLNPPQSGPFELGDYHVHQVIGRGGMGVVYEAIQVSLNRRVALKILPFAAALDPHHLLRFQTEAQAAAQLHHTNIVPVFAVGCERGVHFYAMQFIEGRTLAALIHDRREVSEAAPGLTRPAGDRECVRSVARLGIQAAEALDHAHRQGIIHRDIKPANLLVDLHGNLWITDFGLARFLNEPGLTLTGDLIGTLRYMSPEQALGKRLVLDHRTDIYSLGATLYELLTLHSVVEGRDRQEVLGRIAQDEPVPPRRIDPSIPRDLETILLKALSREPEDRYATAQELADDLRRFLEHRPIEARRPSMLERVSKWLRRYPTLSWAALTVLVLVLLGLTASLLAVNRERARTAEKKGELESLARTLEWELYISRVNQAHGDYLAGNVSRAESILKSCPESLRNWEWRYVRKLCNQERYSVEAHDLPGGVDRLPVLFTPDGSRWLSGAGNTNIFHEPGGLRLWDTATGRCLRDLAPEGLPGIRAMALNPAGSLIAVAFVDAEEPIQLREATSGRLVGVLPLPGADAGASDLAFSPDGRRLANLRRHLGRLVVWDVADRTRIRDWLAHSSFGNAVAFHPDGQWIATSGEDDQLRLWDSTSGRLVRVLEGEGGGLHVSHIAFSPDGKRLASAGQDEMIRIWNVESGKSILVIPSQSGFVTRVSFSPQGDQIAAASGQSVTVWEANTGKGLFTLRGQDHFGTGLDHSSDGTRLITSSLNGFVRLWEKASLAPRVFRAIGWVNSVAFSPDGARLVASQSQSGVEVWDLSNGRRSHVLLGHGDPARTAWFTPGGDSIVSTSWDATVRCWDAGDGRPPRTIVRNERPEMAARDGDHGTSMNDLALSPDGTLAAAGGWDWTVRVVEIASGLERLRYRGHRGIVWSVAFSPDGRTIASAGADRTVRVWDAATGHDLWTATADLSRESTTQRKILAFCPDGRYLAGCVGYGSRGPFAVKLWTADSGAEIRTFREPGSQVNAVTFSPDGSRMATAGENRTVTLWDTATGQAVLTLRGHTEAVLCVAFSPDGRRLATGSIDATVRIWDAP